MLKKSCGGLLKVELQGGLGNILFQISNGLNLSLEYDLPIKFIDKGVSEPNLISSMFSLHFKKDYKFNGKEIIQIDNQNHDRCKFNKFLEQNSTYNKIHLSSKHSIISGYFQSIKYFNPIQKFLRSTLDHIKVEDRKFYEIGVHIRLGDYLSRQNRRIYYQLEPKYFMKGINSLKTKANILNEEITVFTNDQKVFELKYSSIFAGKSLTVFKSNSLISFATLCSFRNIVISNSTFSWWAAWLGQSNTVAPNFWYTDKSKLQFDKVNFELPNWELI
jgi:hypothetical protein